MRTKSSKFEQLVQKNKQDLLDDEERLSQIEMRLERKQAGIDKEKQDA